MRRKAAPNRRNVRSNANFERVLSIQHRQQWACRAARASWASHRFQLEWARSSPYNTHLWLNFIFSFARKSSSISLYRARRPYWVFPVSIRSSHVLWSIGGHSAVASYLFARASLRARHYENWRICVCIGPFGQHAAFIQLVAKNLIHERLPSASHVLRLRSSECACSSDSVQLTL